MNIGLILFVSSLLLGNTGDKSTNTANENQSPEAIVSKSTKSNDSSFDDQVSVNSVQIPADFTATETLSNYSLSISGNAETNIKQDEHYVFTPFAQDINNEQLNFRISNKPTWATFDSRTGTLFGQPTNWDTGITKDIVINVMNTEGINPKSYKYQWYSIIPSSSGNKIKNATGKTFKPTQDHIKKFLYVIVTFEDNGGKQYTKKSNYNERVKDINDVASGKPIINGIRKQGETLSADPSEVKDADGIDLKEQNQFQWKRNGKPIKNATNKKLSAYA